MLPPACVTVVGAAADLVIFHLYVRVKDVVAVFLTVRSTPAHTVAELLAEPVVPVVLVVKVAVLGWLVQVPAWSPLKVWLSVSVVGLGSLEETVRACR